MTSARTGGMTAVGVLNIVLGSIGTLLGLLVVLGGGMLAAGGAAMEAEMGADAEGLGTAAAAGGALLIVMGLIGAAAWCMMFIAGIGVLKLAPWSRTLSIACAGIIGLLTLINMFTGGIGIFSIVIFGYCGVVIGAFFKPEWKAAFSGQTTTVGEIGADEFRTAA